MSFWMSVIGFLGGPVVQGLLKAYQFHLTATTTDKQTAADLAGKEIAAQVVDMQTRSNVKIAEIGHPFEPEKLAFYVWLAYYAKILIWDKMLKLGVTDPIQGAAAVWSALIVSFYFGQRGAENVAKIIKGIRS